MIEPKIEGQKCSECGQFVKLYKRKLTSSMAYGLILLRKKSKLTEDWVHVENYFKQLNIPSSIRGDISKLRYWKFIEKKDGERDDGSKRNGYYKITGKGIDFVKGETKVPKFIHLYNNKFYGFAGDLIDIKEALGNKFSYEELMGEGLYEV